MDILNLSDNEILELITPVAKELESGWNENNYSKFIKHVAEDKKDSIDIENFNKQRKEEISELGESTLGKFIKLHRNPTNIVAIWEISFQKRTEPGLGVYRFSGNKGSIKIESSLHHY